MPLYLSRTKTKTQKNSNNMKVLKFGGTSVGTPQRMKEVSRLVTEDGQQKLVVLSAMSGTTNSLVEIAQYLYGGNKAGADDVINRLRAKYYAHVPELLDKKENQDELQKFLEEKFNYLQSFYIDNFSEKEEKIILAQGELISTYMVTCYLKEQGIKAALLPALDFMKTNADAEPDMQFISEKASAQLKSVPGMQIYITQGFICRNYQGDIDNLQRGGSDYTASILGAAIKADEIQIWTDIDGMHNNDPRVVDKTQPVRHLHFEEAAELAYFGAKILHPTCIQPAKAANIPVAVAAKENITAIKIKSSRMLLAHGFLKKVFEVFETYRTSIDMICTSEVGVSMSIDNTKHLEEIVAELKKYGTVTVDSGMCIVCVVGDMVWENLGFESRAMDALADIPVRMISYGGSNYNISFLIKETDKKAALQRLSDVLFNNK